MFENKNIILTGFMCSGKTFLGQKIAKKTNKIFIDTDQKIEQFLNMSISEIFLKYGESYFRKIEFLTCKKIWRDISLLSKLSKNSKKFVVATGGGTFINKKNYYLYRLICKNSRKDSLILFIDSPFEVCYERCLQQNNRPLFNALSKNDFYDLFFKRRKIYLEIADFVLTQHDNLV